LIPTSLFAETLSIYWNPDHLYKVYDQIIDEFAAEKGLEVNKQVMNWSDFNTKLKADFAGGTPPDLIEVPSPWIAEFGAGGHLEDLTAEIKAWPEHEDWFESTWIETGVDGKLYGMKLHHTAFAMFYNRDHFEKAGLDPDNPPATLEEFVETVTMISDKLGPQIKGYAFDPTGQYLLPFLASAETPLLVKDGKVAIDTPTVRNTLKTLQKLARSGKVFIPEPGGEEARQTGRLLFMSGRVSMLISGPWEIGNIKKNFPDLNYGVAMVPHLAGVDALTLTAGTGLAIPKGAKAPKEVVWELMQRLTTVETEVAGTLEAGMLMPRKGWAADERVQGEKAVQLFGPILPQATPFDIDVKKLGLPEITWGGAVLEKLYQTMIYSDKDMDAALDAYIEEANGLLAGK
jgi:multiple sugar transport system substrate-binding protein